DCQSNSHKVQHEHKKDYDDQGSPQKSEFFPDDCKYEVGMTFRNIHDTLSKAFAFNAARADCPHRVAQLEAALGGIHLRLQPSDDAHKLGRPDPETSLQQIRSVQYAQYQCSTRCGSNCECRQNNP